MTDDRAVDNRGGHSLQARLKACMAAATKTEKAIASYMLANLTSLPFETACSLAAKIQASEASIGRFCRALGFRHLKDLKQQIQADLGDRAWLIGDRLREFHRQALNNPAGRTRGLDLEIAAIVRNYEIAATAEFANAAKRLAHCPQVFVAGFQTERGHAAYLAHTLEYLRPNVRLLDLAAGHFADVLLCRPEQACLVLVDARRYSRLTRKLAMQAKERGIEVTLITDPYCDWGGETATETFAALTGLNQFWDTTSTFASLISLMTNAVFNELGVKVEERMEKISDLYNEFIGHVGAPYGFRK